MHFSFLRNEIQETEVATAEDEETAVENEIITAEIENEEMWVEINLENEVAFAETEHRSSEIEAQPQRKKRDFKTQLKKFLSSWCCCCGKKDWRPQSSY